jgi:hypothetical protein
VYSTVAHFEDDLSTWTDSQIVGLAKQAYDDMGIQYNKDMENNNNIRFRKPAAMSVIVLGKSAYFASSMTGGGAFFYKPVPDKDGRNPYKNGIFNPEMKLHCDQIRDAFTACQFVSGDSSGRRLSSRHGQVSG